MYMLFLIILYEKCGYSYSSKMEPNPIRPSRGKARGRPGRPVFPNIEGANQPSSRPTLPMPPTINLMSSSQTAQPRMGNMPRPPRQMPPRPISTIHPSRALGPRPIGNIGESSSGLEQEVNNHSL